MAIRRVDLSGRKNVRLTKSEINSLIPRAALDIEAATKSILPILEKVRTGNESEILNLGVEFDGIKAPALRVPKTELAKALANYLFDDDSMMTRIDMSEYQEKHTVSRLVGAPPGYVGYDEGGQLTEAVRRKPYSVVLLDEIEKAHPDVWNILLQVLDDGHLTDNKGRTVNFKNTIIIMTSNMGSHLIQEAFEGVTEKNVEQKVEKSKTEVLALLKQTIRPEFLNRVDEIIMFSPLLQKQMASIVNIQLNNLKTLVAENGIDITFSKYLVDYLADQGFDMQLGARPLKRLIQKMVVNEFSKKILSGEIDKTKKVLIDIFDGVIVFRNES